MIGLDQKTDQILRHCLAEDIGSGDLTTTVIPKEHVSKGDAIFKEEAILCGLTVAERVYRLVDENLRFLPAAKEGDMIQPGKAIYYVEGSTRSILSAERVVLNFLSHMSAIATKARKFVNLVGSSQTKILDTRKTTPGLRQFDKYAVRTGGGTNHRFGLYDGVLIKDNHWLANQGRGIDQIIQETRRRVPKNASIGVEVKNLKELESVLKTPCDYILLDNFTVNDIREALNIRNRERLDVPLEVSGGVNLENVKSYVDLGVDRISIGALTHTIKSIDISFNLIAI